MGRQDFEYVFIITYARSGSTLLQSILNSLPGWQIRGENNNALFHVYKLVEAIRFARNIHGNRETAPDMPWYGADRLTPRLFTDRMLTTFVDGVLKPDPEMRVLGCKEIRHTPHFMSRKDFRAYMQFILDHFERSRIVFNSRNADDVARSGWLKDTDSASVIRDVESCDRSFEEFSRQSDRVMHVRYDDFVADRSVIQALLEFLGETFDPQRVEDIFNKPLTHGKPEGE